MQYPYKRSWYSASHNWRSACISWSLLSDSALFSRRKGLCRGSLKKLRRSKRGWKDGWTSCGHLLVLLMWGWEGQYVGWGWGWVRVLRKAEQLTGPQNLMKNLQEDLGDLNVVFGRLSANMTLEEGVESVQESGNNLWGWRVWWGWVHLNIAWFIFHLWININCFTSFASMTMVVCTLCLAEMVCMTSLNKYPTIQFEHPMAAPSCLHPDAELLNYLLVHWGSSKTLL